MPSSASAILTAAEYVAARLAAVGVSLLDVDATERTAAALGRLLYRLDRRHRDRTLRNIRLAFPHWSDQQARRVARDSFAHLIQLVIEVVHTPRVLQPTTWPKHVRLASLGPAIELLNARHPAILLTGHLGNWEVLGYLLALLGYDVDAIARPLDNPLINRWLLGIRQRQGMRIITKWDATDRMIHVLQTGGALGFIADQNAGDKGLFVPFFGRLASTYKSIGLLAMSHNAAVICGYAHRVAPGYQFELGVEDIIHPEDWQHRHDPLFYITARYSRAMEMMIRRRPEQYLWMHRRWKSRPRHERQGKPMPKALRRNLEDLPWMNQAQLEQLLHPPAPLPSD